MEGEGEGCAELFEGEAFFGEPMGRPIGPGSQAAFHAVTGAGWHGPAAAREPVGTVRGGYGRAGAEQVAPGAGPFGEDRWRRAVAVPGLAGWGVAVVERFPAGEAGASPHPWCDQGKRAGEGLLEEIHQEMRQLRAAQLHEMALAAEAIAACGDGMAAEVGEAEAGFEGDAVFEEQGVVPFAHPLIAAQARMQVGHRLPGIGVQAQRIGVGGRLAARGGAVAHQGPLLQGQPAAGAGLAGVLLPFGRMPGPGGLISLAARPGELVQGLRVGVAGCLAADPLPQGEWRRQPEIAGFAVVAEGSGGVQVVERCFLLGYTAGALQLAGDEAGDGGRIGREVFAGAAGERFGREHPAAGAIEEAEWLKQQQVGKGKGAHGVLSRGASRQRSRPLITRARSISHWSRRRPSSGLSGGFQPGK